MAIVVSVTTPGLDAGLYEQSIREQGFGGALPPGCSAHIAGPGPDGWRVVTVWESEEAAKRFMTDTLRPVMARLGVAPPPAPPVIYPLHALVV
ncbi:hypothetical protein ABZ570_02590 [Micromonospora sp. NPDC007271]|uniref:hypothetical protein n=1 Tax=Micromonospora sp. NPDC007271 TaxID=3154587 RepID=UPI0033DE4CAE